MPASYSPGMTGTPRGLHEGKQLPVAGVEEDVPDLAALLHRHGVTAHRREAEDALVEGAACAVHVEGGEADVGKGLCVP